jgi:hypothetical protein
MMHVFYLACRGLMTTTNHAGSIGFTEFIPESKRTTAGIAINAATGDGRTPRGIGAGVSR